MTYTYICPRCGRRTHALAPITSCVYCDRPLVDEIIRNITKIKNEKEQKENETV